MRSRSGTAVRLILTVALLAAPAGLHAQERYAIDWDAVGSEAMQHFKALIRIDTSNPPGNETEAANYLRDVLARDGVESQLFEIEPGRANLVTRIPGNGSGRPVLVMAHTDVVGAQPEAWSVDPFAAVTRDGYVYGRGSTDDKDNVTAGLMLMLLLRRTGIQLDRDVIFLAEAGEEATPEVGIDFMLDEHPELLDAEYCLAEGGGALSVGGTVRQVTIATTEKFPIRARLVAHGTAGHGSIPRLDNAVSLIATAVARIAAWQTPLRLNETTRSYFRRLAEISAPEDAVRYRGILDPAEQPWIERYFAEHEPGHYTMLRTSVVPTMIDAGFRLNVIPSEAEAFLDIRALPDEDPEAFYTDLAGVINDPHVEIVPQPVYRPASPPSGLDTDMFRALEAATSQVYPQAVAIPTMLAGATDMAQVRARGAQCYGFGPARVAEDTGAGGGAHGDDERLPESSLLPFVQYLWYAVTGVAATDR